MPLVELDDIGCGLYHKRFDLKHISGASQRGAEPPRPAIYIIGAMRLTGTDVVPISAHTTIGGRNFDFPYPDKLLVDTDGWYSIGVTIKFDHHCAAEAIEHVGLLVDYEVYKNYTG